MLVKLVFLLTLLVVFFFFGGVCCDMVCYAMNIEECVTMNKICNENVINLRKQMANGCHRNNKIK